MLKLSKKQIDDFRSVYKDNCLDFAEDVYTLIGGAVIVFMNGNSEPIEVYDRNLGNYKPYILYATVISDGYAYDYLNSDLPIKIEDYIFGLSIGNPKLHIDFDRTHGNYFAIRQVFDILTTT